MEEFVSGYKHLKSESWYIFLDEVGERFRLLDRAGATVVLPMNLFDEEPTVFNIAANPPEFAPEQVASYKKMVTAQMEQHARTERQEKIRQQERLVREPTRVPTPKRTGEKKSGSIMSQRSGVAATWSGSQLSFYRPQIDRLGPKQSFKVVVDGVGDFVISKADFLQVFAEVVLSPKYKQEGFYSYTAVPEKALRFLTPPA